MADVDFDEYDVGYDAGHGQMPRGAHRGRRWINLAAGAVSVALLLGAGVWGYRIAVREVMGIPVIKAQEGPMRIAPDNPGGEVAAHQGLSVNDVAAIGVATPLPEEIALAPRAVDLSAEDTPGLAAEPPAALRPAAAEEPPVQPLLPAPAQLAATAAPPVPLAPITGADAPMDPLTTIAPLPENAPNADVLALADQLAAGAVPLTAPEAEVAAEAFVNAPVVPGGIGTSLRPLPRPGGRSVSAAAVDSAVTAAIAVAATEIDAATLQPGTRLVQFGAFDSADEARAKWDKLAGTFGELLTSKSRVIQSAESGGRTFYRLRAHGFSDEDDARRFCAAISAEGAECIPVALR
ncbi:SPOR domain-containing protein [Gemmobacter fulvus]|uniref:SPOR domain-containing protein n=1 Tax=Gemmobacter fulvus TaxID=2840474 RepID=UPI0027964160|nr:SPOR domain-containing protein [Gemmobacter fulvus]MDQ1847916.1 SPOR domain-containing protein [Gemmobacter fulvus]